MAEVLLENKNNVGVPGYPQLPHPPCSGLNMVEALGALTWRGQVDHISVANVDGPVSVERAENLNQVSRLGFRLQNQEKGC